MEIIHLILGKANPERMNGVNKVVYQLATQQAAAAKRVAVWGITKDLSVNYGKRNFTTLLFQAYDNPFKIDRELKKALLSKQDKETVFHLHGGWIPIYSSLTKFMTRHNIPYVLTPHGAYNSIAMERSNLKKKVYFKFFEKPLLQAAKRVHAIGESEVEGLSKIYPNDKSFLMPYGFDAEQLNGSKLDKETPFTIGFIGRLDIYTKGLDLTIDAFKSFQQTYPNSRLWIIGDSDDRPKLEAMIAEQQIENVTLWGAKFGEEKKELLGQMHAFVHASRNEGLPASVLEAANVGIPCIVTKATNVGSFITAYKAGVAIDNEDTLALSSAFEVLYRAWEDDRIQTIAKNAKRMVQEAFNWKNLVQEFDRLYK